MELLHNPKEIIIQGEEITLLPQKAIYMKRENALLLADVHFGKSGHFRNAGIPIPYDVAIADLKKLDSLLNEFKIDSLIMLGDLFHSKANFDLRLFEEWRNYYHHIKIILVKGNHDILQNYFYKLFGIEVHYKFYELNNFILSHKYCEELSGKYTLCGHVHPAVRLVGKGRQGITLPCFYFRERFGILPAFGRFTGKYIIIPGENDRMFVIANSDE